MDVKNVYQVPLALHEEGLSEIILEKLGLPVKEPKLNKWNEINQKISKPPNKVDIALVGKYVDLKESY